MPCTYVNKGIALGSLGQLDDAIKCCNKALELNPDDANPYINKGVALGSLGQFDDAIKCYNKALELNPDDANPYINKGVVTCVAWPVR